MSILGREIASRTVVGLAAVLIVAALLPVMTTPAAREIRLVASGMAFYLEGDLSRPNPAIEVKAGERVRVVLTNMDRGLRHDFAVPVAAAITDGLRWNEQAEVSFDAPEAPGSYEYVCQPHRLMMHGTLRVVE